MAHRLPAEFVRKTLHDFTAGVIDAVSASARLEVSRTRLYELRAEWIKDQFAYQPGASGGNHGQAWPAEVIAFLKGFLPLQNPPNFQLVADEMERLHNFKRVRSTVEDHVKTHFAHLIPQPERKPRHTVVSATLTSANSGSTTAPFTSAGPRPKNKPCC